MAKSSAVTQDRAALQGRARPVQRVTGLVRRVQRVWPVRQGRRVAQAQPVPRAKAVQRVRPALTAPQAPLAEPEGLAIQAPLADLAKVEAAVNRVRRVAWAARVRQDNQGQAAHPVARV